MYEKYDPTQEKMLCIQIGTAEVNLQSLLKFGEDLMHQPLGVLDRYNEIIHEGQQLMLYSL
jgi:hypothetical protein